MDKLTPSEQPLNGRYQRYLSNSRKVNTFDGPLKAIRLCLLGIVLPGLLIAVPIYMRFKVYDHQLYPIGLSDMRLIDSKVSTTWCQKQNVHSNATFNAFLMGKLPQITNDLTSVSMTRHLLLKDDMKEYWAFYLLKGSSVTVSTCVRWPGASLILIRGHKHLHECAYIGDDSSEELEELLAIAAEKGIDTKSHTIENPSNDPNLLRKLSSDIRMHDPKAQESAHKYTFSQKDKSKEDSETAKEMQEVLNIIYQKNIANTQKQLKKGYDPKVKVLQTNQHKHHQTMDNIHKHRDTDYDKKEEKNIKFEMVTNKTNGNLNQTSTEIFDDMYESLKKLGPNKGHNMLENLKKHLENERPKENKLLKNDGLDKSRGGVETLHEKLIRLKRELIIKTALSDDLNEDDERGNLAIEDGFVPDEHADHHEIINETTLNDRSNSEFWSSFSSSEEALLNCAGLILSLPLTPHRKCEKHRNDKDFKNASFANKITYSVPTNGYYFFIFNSENEVQENYIQVHFDLLKTVYNVSNPDDKCSNTTEKCSLPLNFFSDQKVVFEMPYNNNDSLWNKEFIVVSECEPRTSIYLICVLMVPLLILIFAFQ